MQLDQYEIDAMSQLKAMLAGLGIISQAFLQWSAVPETLFLAFV